MLRFLCTLSLVVLLAAFDYGCRKRHVGAPVLPPPAPTPAETAPATTPTPPPTPSAPAAQPPSPLPPEEPNQKNRPPQQQPAPPSPQTTPQRRSSRPGEPNGAGQPNQAPHLGDILTPEQERQYNSAIDQSLARAQSSLGSIGNRQLTKEQQAVVDQIQSFIRQAQTTRKSSLPAARSLAERADVLARDLAGSLR